MQTPSTVSRRGFFARTAQAAGGTVLLTPGLAGLISACGEPHLSGPPSLRRAAPGNGGYGPLAPHPDCPELALPRDFRCARLSVAGSVMDDGHILPNAFDGMAAFPGPDGSIRLVRNHEIRDLAGTAPPPGGATLAYDPRGVGGTTTLEVRVTPDGLRHKVREFLSLNGTIVNCAGGLTPWNSWLTCEETTAGAAQGWGAEHGYVFDVPAGADGLVEATPLRDMGRFVHEALALDPATGIVYLTEDRSFAPGNPAAPGSGFFRFLPQRAGDLSSGRLQVAAVVDHPNYHTIVGQKQFARLPVRWVDIEDPDPASAATDPSAVFREGLSKGAMIFQRLEGCWYGDGSIFLNSTSGGAAGAGQVWQYRPAGRSAGHLFLIFESPGPEVLDAPDNLVVTPRGGLILCEDGDGEQYLRGLTQHGQIFDFALNLADDTEFAGACFSPDGETLFVNIFGDSRRRSDGGYTHHGMTFAVWGPWERGAL